MWTKVWLIAGRADEMPGAGDFTTEEVGPESILMARQQDGSIRAFFNTCRHRGNRLVQVHDGSLGGFTCPYHSWKFSIDGTLVDVPDAEDAIGGNPCGRLNLVEMKCETFAGFVWINMDPAAVTLRNYLGPIWQQWSAYPLDTMKRYVAKSVSVDVNWKVIQDNFTESYHVQVLHPEAIPFMEVDYSAMQVSLFPRGHTLASFPAHAPSRRVSAGRDKLIGDWLAARLAFWGLDAADFVGREFETRAAIQAQIRKVGPSRGYGYTAKLSDAQLTDFLHYTVFPNFTASITSDGLQYLRVRPHASDPTKCTLDHFWYGFEQLGATGKVATTDGERERDAEVQRQRYEHGAQSSGWQVDQDLSQALTQQRGLRSRAYLGANLMRQEGRLKHYADMLKEYVGE